jgi:hypothetical protein
MRAFFGGYWKLVIEAQSGYATVVLQYGAVQVRDILGFLSFLGQKKLRAHGNSKETSNRHVSSMRYFSLSKGSGVLVSFFGVRQANLAVPGPEMMSISKASKHKFVEPFSNPSKSFQSCFENLPVKESRRPTS